MVKIIVDSGSDMTRELAEKLDVAIYQHLRYLPAYWHSHSFLEVAYVLEGSCTHYICTHFI